jgi:hypothetical protein
MKKQHQPKALDGLDRDRSAGHGGEGLLHEIVREGTESRTWSWHGGILSLPGFFGGSASLYQKSVETTTLFVKRTTKLGELVTVVSSSIAGMAASASN